jgi:hypothetical protein
MCRVKVTLILVLVVALAAAAFVLVGQRPDFLPEDYPEIRRGAEDEDDPGPLDGAPAGILTGRETDRPRRDGERRSPAGVRLDQVARGGLVVRPLDADGKAVDPASIAVGLERVGRSLGTTPLALSDRETGAWTFERVPVGRWRVRVTGDHVVEGMAEVDVVADRTQEVEVAVSPAGSIAYSATFPSGKAPEQVIVALLDHAGQPVRAHFQVRTETVLTSPRAGTEVTQGPKGVIFGIPPGSYRVRIRTADGDDASADAEVLPGRTAVVDVVL